MSDHHHDHDHDHSVDGDHIRTVKPMVDEITDFEVLEIALRELLHRRAFSPPSNTGYSPSTPSRSVRPPAARLVAKAWLDPEFKELVLSDALEASKAVGVDWLDPQGSAPQRLHRFQGPGGHSRGAPRHRVCTVLVLSASDPRKLPEWYRTPNYRRRIVRWPRQVLSEFGLQSCPGRRGTGGGLNQKHRFMVMPMRPEGTDGWTEDQLAEIITRDCLIGVALPRPGVTTNVTPLVRPPSGRLTNERGKAKCRRRFRRS